MVLIDAIDFILLFSLFDHSSGANDVGMSWRDRGNRDVAICGGHHQRGDTTSSSPRSIGEGEIFLKKKKKKIRAQVLHSGKNRHKCNFCSCTVEQRSGPRPHQATQSANIPQASLLINRITH